MTSMLAATTMTWLLLMVFPAVCGLMILVVLVQKPSGGGLSGAFGGAGGGGGGQGAFGAKAGDVLTWFTVGLFVLFLLCAIGLTWQIRDDVQTPTASTAQPTQQTTTSGGGAPSGDASGSQVPADNADGAGNDQGPDSAQPTGDNGGSGPENNAPPG